MRWSLGSGAVLALLTFCFVARWAALVPVLLAIAVAAIAYRVERPTIDVEHPEAWASASADRPSAERVDQ